MATAQIAQSFDTDGNCMTLTLTVTGDVLDSSEILDECVKRAAILVARGRGRRRRRLVTTIAVRTRAEIERDLRTLRGDLGLYVTAEMQAKVRERIDAVLDELLEVS